MTELKSNDILTEQLELLELLIRAVTHSVRERQQRFLFKPCRLGKLEGCVWCKMKRYFLRKRYK